MTKPRAKNADTIESFEITVEDIVAGAPRINETTAAEAITSTTDDEISVFRMRYSSYIGENSWRYHSPRFEQTLPDMLKKDGKMTEENEGEYLAIMEAHRRRTHRDSFLDELIKLPSHYLVLKILGCA